MLYPIIIICLSILLIIVSICLFRLTNLCDDLLLKLQKKDTQYWNQAAEHKVTIGIMQKQKAHLEAKLRKFTSAYLYLELKE